MSYVLKFCRHFFQWATSDDLPRAEAVPARSARGSQRPAPPGQEERRLRVLRRDHLSGTLAQWSRLLGLCPQWQGSRALRSTGIGLSCHLIQGTIVISGTKLLSHCTHSLCVVIIFEFIGISFLGLVSGSNPDPEVDLDPDPFLMIKGLIRNEHVRIHNFK